MKRLMSGGEYFSVSEMRKRNPLLFDQLLGNFMKNPERKINEAEHSYVPLDYYVNKFLAVNVEN